MSPTCRRPSCENQARKRGPNVNGYAAKFCSPQCELQFENIRSDEKAREAAEAQESERWP